MNEKHSHTINEELNNRINDSIFNNYYKFDAYVKSKQELLVRRVLGFHDNLVVEFVDNKIVRRKFNPVIFTD